MPNPPSAKTLAQRFMVESTAPQRLCASILLKGGHMKPLRLYLEELGYPRKTGDGLKELARDHAEREEQEDAAFRAKYAKARGARGRPRKV